MQIENRKKDNFLLSPTPPTDTYQLPHTLQSQQQQIAYIYTLIPKQLRIKYQNQHNEHPEQFLYTCLTNLHLHHRVQELKKLFDQLGADLNIWINKNTSQEKFQYLINAVQKNVVEALKKVNTQSSSYINLVNSNKIAQRSNKIAAERQKNNQFQWLTLNTKNQMLKSKLKTKLVQTLNEFKNQSRLRAVMGKSLEDHEKIKLQDQSIDLYQDDIPKINYEWTAADEELFVDNIKKLKEKFTQTQFLKNCHRFKFITNSQLKTLACQQISRKLDKSNKAFLSRQFLLDKYFSTNENLSDKQMKFILKTSPLLSKCVDKTFVRSAIKNIRYEDIDKMELGIAQEIIQKFQMIRNQVKKSRKAYKQNQNNQAKKRIQVFEKQKQFKQTRSNMNDKLNAHKTKLMRNLQYRPNTAKNLKATKQNFDQFQQNGYQISQKVAWPIPLNNHHPSTGLFIKDCSQQINQEYNEYEKNYLKDFFKDQDQNTIKKSPSAKAAMIKYYTGGPLDSNYKMPSNILSSSGSSFNAFKKGPAADKETISAMCEAFKIVEYRKQIMQRLNSFEIDEEQQESFVDKKTISASKSVVDFCLSQFTKRTKKSGEQEELINANTGMKASVSTQKIIKDKIIEGRQKAKMSLYTKKLHSLAAQNAFLSLKTLNAKFTPAQVNSLDAKGNTALFYAIKNKNVDFIDYLLSLKADVNVKCSKGATPLHNAFRTSNYPIVCKCLAGAIPPNLNALDDEGKTPLAYCCRKILEMLGLQQGVVSVSPGQKLKFNNNALLCTTEESNNENEELQMRTDIKRKNNSRQILTCN